MRAVRTTEARLPTVLVALLLFVTPSPASARSSSGADELRADGTWRRTLDAVAAAGVRPPPARALAEPGRFPPGLLPVVGQGGQEQLGVAHTTVDGETVFVLPRETVAAVTAALASVGRPYESRPGTGPRGYSCAGLVRAVYAKAGIELPTSVSGQLDAGRRVSFADTVPGDVVFVGPSASDVRSVGIVGPGRTMVAANARAAEVVVTALPAEDSVRAVVRPSLGAGVAGRESPPVPGAEVRASSRTESQAESRAPEAGTGAEAGPLVRRCGGVEAAGGGGHRAAPLAWGGYPNGLVPSSALCPLDTAPHALRCDAARDLVAMSDAFTDVLGEPLCLTDSYRAFGTQLALHSRKPGLAAEPGTSAHGWGRAVDLCGGAETFGTPEHDWLVAHAHEFGWGHPAWAEEGERREEPWHWEYVGG